MRVSMRAKPTDAMLANLPMRLVAPLLCCVFVAACSPAAPSVIVTPAPAPTPAPSVTPAPPVRIAFEIPRNGAPVDMRRTPFPTELARLADGHLDLRAYPGRDSPLLAEYLVRAAEDLDGFSIAPVVYFHFQGPLALEELTESDTSRTAAAKIALVDVDAASPEKGTFYPLAFRATSRDMHYLEQGTLAVRPLDGFVLRPGTLYAAVVRRSFGDVPGGLRTPPDLDAILAQAPRADAAEERARALHAPALTALETLGIPRADIAALAVFRTGSPPALADKLVSAVDALVASPAPSEQKTPLSPEEGATLPPHVVRAEWDASLAEPGLYRTLRGTYCTPSFQAKVENAPFLEREGGRVAAGADGVMRAVPVPATASFAAAECPGQLRARFVLSVPETPPPRGGYPLLVTAHGTGGNAQTFLGKEDFAGWAASEGFAAVSTDQPLNGGAESGRPGASGPLVLPLGIPLPVDKIGPPVAFYNPLYPGAASGNMLQAIADAAVLVRLFGGLDFASLSTAKKQPLLRSKKGDVVPRFDAGRTVLAGHSQGCQSMAILGALDSRARGVLLSGCGGDVRLGVLHRKIMVLAPWITLALGLDPEELSMFHPLMALVRNLADAIDPIAFARHYWDPLPGRHAQKVLHIEGLRDSYNPEVASEALAIALRVAPFSPLLKPIAGLSLLPAPAGTSRLIAQYAPTASPDGHFVLYHEPGASLAFRSFLRTAAPP